MLPREMRSRPANPYTLSGARSAHSTGSGQAPSKGQAIWAAALLALVACKTQHVYVAEDAGPECEDNLELVNGTCMFVCHRDGDCMAQEHCNLFTGQCEAR